MRARAVLLAISRTTGGYELWYCRERLLDITQYKIDECSMSGYERKNSRSIPRILSLAPLNPTKQIGQGPEK